MFEWDGGAQARLTLGKIGRWAKRSVPGFCNLTSQVGDCAFGTMGSWPIPETHTANWSAGTSWCLDMCSNCSNCAAISLSLQYKDCSWYSGTQSGACDISAGSRALNHHKSVIDVRTAPVVRHQLLKPITCTKPQTGRQDLFGTAAKIHAGDLDCDERYFSHVTCAGKQFLFSRREYSCCDMWDTIVRVAAVGSSHFGSPMVALNHTIGMSHNTAFLCIANRTVAAIGGQLPDGAEELSPQSPGILRRDADATNLPLNWTEPILVASGLKQSSGCIDARWDKGCDFDGKISAVFFQGRLLIFTRANMLVPPHFQNDSDRAIAATLDTPDRIPHNDAGGRHVQVAVMRPRLPKRWEPYQKDVEPWQTARPFKPLTFDGVKVSRENNIYLFSVRPIGLQALLALFPAVLGGRGGVWCSTSRDALSWSKPLRVMPVEAIHGVRSRVHPVEVVGDERDGPLDAVLLQHDVYFHLGPPMHKCKDIERPHLCTYPYRHDTPLAHRCEAVRAALRGFGQPTKGEKLWRRGGMHGGRGAQIQMF